MSLLTDPSDLRLAARLARRPSSPVRDILALTERPASSPSPAASRRPSCSTRRGCAPRSPPRWRYERRRTRAAVLHDRGRPGAARGRRRPARRPRAADHGRASCSSPPARSRRSRWSPPCCSSRATPCSSRSRPTSPRCRPSSSPARGSCRCRATRTASIPRRSPRSPSPAAPGCSTPSRPSRTRPAARCPLDRRAALVAVAARRGLWLIEDDPTASCATAASRCRALAVARPAPRTACSRSRRSRKIAAPGLRIGWVRAPEALRRPLTVAKQAADLHSSTVDQAAAARWLAPSTSTRTSRGLRDAYGARRDALRRRAAPPRCPPGSTSTTGPTAACSCGRGCRTAGTPTRLLRRALAHDVAFVPGAPFFAGPPDRATLRLSFTAHPPAEIAEGLRRLRAAWAG